MDACFLRFGLRYAFGPGWGCLRHRQCGGKNPGCDQKGPLRTDRGAGHGGGQAEPGLRFTQRPLSSPEPAFRSQGAALNPAEPWRLTTDLSNTFSMSSAETGRLVSLTGPARQSARSNTSLTTSSSSSPTRFTIGRTRAPPRLTFLEWISLRHGSNARLPRSTGPRGGQNRPAGKASGLSLASKYSRFSPCEDVTFVALSSSPSIAHFLRSRSVPRPEVMESLPEPEAYLS